MSAESNRPVEAPLDLTRWQMAPMILMVVGGIGVLLGILVPGLREQFAFSWLLAFMFFLSITLGALFLVLVHHLFDASWSVPIRRFVEHLAYLAPVMTFLFLPLALFAPKIYGWMTMEVPDHALHAKEAFLNKPLFYLISFLCLGVWWFLSYKLRYWSLRQDETGSAECTYRMRFHSYWGIFAFAFTLSLGALMWMKSLQHEWFSTMYGVYYFAGSVWLTLGTIYILTILLQRQGFLRDVVHHEQYYFIGSLLFAFTVFYAYIHFAQYFIIWNANIPEETFWYLVREKGTWWQIGLVLIFGHFFVPFLAIIRIDAKLVFPLMIGIGIWCWLMHFADLSFNIMPVLHPENFNVHWLTLFCFLFMGGVLAHFFIRNFAPHAPYPVKDPRLAEALGIYVAPDEYFDAATERGTSD